MGSIQRGNCPVTEKDLGLIIDELSEKYEALIPINFLRENFRNQLRSTIERLYHIQI